MTNSLRWRLLVFAALTIIVVLVAAGGALVMIFENHVLRRVEQELDIRWLELAKAFELDGEDRPILNKDLADPRYQQPYGAAYWQINGAGGPILRSRSLWDDTLVTNQIPDAEKTRGAFEIVGPNRSELYLVERNVTLNRAGGPLTFALIVASDHADVADLRQAFTLDLAKVLTLIFVVLVIGGWIQLRYGLSPLHALRRKLGELRDGGAQRLAGSFPAEIEQLVDDLNALLDRQDELVEKARARAGALAHGLKTPLTVLSGEIARLEREGQSQRSALLREQCDAIHANVERELARARTHGAVRSRNPRTEVKPMVERLIGLISRVDGAGRIEWAIRVPDRVFAMIEETDFAEIVGNLLDNARKWARTRVLVSYSEENNRAFLTISDDGPGVPSEHVNDIVERGVHFGRAGDQSSGLGLAIVRDMLAEYGMSPMIIKSTPGCNVSFDIGPIRSVAAGRPAAKGAGAHWPAMKTGSADKAALER